MLYRPPPQPHERAPVEVPQPAERIAQRRTRHRPGACGTAGQGLHTRIFKLKAMQDAIAAPEIRNQTSCLSRTCEPELGYLLKRIRASTSHMQEANRLSCLLTVRDALAAVPLAKLVIKMRLKAPPSLRDEGLESVPRQRRKPRAPARRCEER